MDVDIGAEAVHRDETQIAAKVAGILSCDAEPGLVADSSVDEQGNRDTPIWREGDRIRSQPWAP